MSGTSLDFYMQVNVAQIEELFKVKTVSRKLTINGLPAAAIAYDRPQSANSSALLGLRQYIVVSGASAWIMTFTAPPSAMAAYGDQLDQSAKSFTFH